MEEEKKEIGKDLKNINDPQRAEAGKTVKEFIMGLSQISDLIAKVPILANFDFVSAGIRAIQELGLAEGLTPDSLLSIEEMNYLQENALKGIITFISDEVSRDVVGLVVTDGQINYQASLEEQIENGIEGSEIGVIFEENKKNDRSDRLKLFDELYDGKSFSLKNSSFTESSVVDFIRASNAKTRNIGSIRADYAAFAAYARLLKLLPEEDRKKMIREKMRDFKNTKNINDKIKKARLLTMTASDDMAMGRNVQLQIRDMNEKEKAEFFRKNPHLEKYNAESYRIDFELYTRAKGYSNVSSILKALDRKRFKKDRIPSMLEKLCVHYLEAKGKDPDLMLLCKMGIEGFLGKDAFIVNENGEYSLNEKLFIATYNKFSQPNRKVKSLPKIFERGVQTNDESIRISAKSMLRQPNDINRGLLGLMIFDKDDDLVDIFSNIHGGNGAQKTIDNYYQAVIYEKIFNLKSIDHIDTKEAIEFLATLKSRNEDKDDLGEALKKIIVVKTKKEIDFDDDKALVQLYNDVTHIRERDLESISHVGKMRYYRDFKKALKENVIIANKDKIKHGSEKQNIVDESKLEKVNFTTDISEKDRIVKKSENINDLSGKIQVLSKLVHFSSPELSKDMDVLKEGHLIMKFEDLEKFRDREDVSKIVDDPQRNKRTTDYLNGLTKYIHAAQTREALEDDTVKSTAELYYIATKTQDLSLKELIVDELVKRAPDIFTKDERGDLIEDVQTQDRLLALYNSTQEPNKKLESYSKLADISIKTLKESEKKVIKKQLTEEKKNPQKYYHRDEMDQGTIDTAAREIYSNKEEKRIKDIRNALKKKTEGPLTEKEKEDLFVIIKNDGRVPNDYLKKYVEENKQIYSPNSEKWNELSQKDEEKKLEVSKAARIEYLLGKMEKTKINYSFSKMEEENILKLAGYLLKNEEKYPEQLKRFAENASKISSKLVTEENGKIHINEAELIQIHFDNTGEMLKNVSSFYNMFVFDSKKSIYFDEYSIQGRRNRIHADTLIQKVQRDISLSDEQKEKLIAEIHNRNSAEMQSEWDNYQEQTEKLHKEVMTNEIEASEDKKVKSDSGKNEVREEVIETDTARKNEVVSGTVSDATFDKAFAEETKNMIVDEKNAAVMIASTGEFIPEEEARKAHNKDVEKLVRMLGEADIHVDESQDKKAKKETSQIEEDSKQLEQMDDKSQDEMEL